MLSASDKGPGRFFCVLVESFFAELSGMICWMMAQTDAEDDKHRFQLKIINLCY